MAAKRNFEIFCISAASRNIGHFFNIIIESSFKTNQI